MEHNVGKVEQFIINRYAAAELAGALLLGKMARKVKELDVVNNLTKHCMEEARHSMVWYDLIKRLNIPLIEVHDDEGENYFSHIGKAGTIIDFLAFTQVFELRVPAHFEIHANWTKNEEVKKVLKMLIPEEGFHILWVKKFLQDQIENGNQSVVESLERFSKLENEVFHKDLDNLEKMGEDGAEFAKTMRENIQEYEKRPKWWQK